MSTNYYVHTPEGEEIHLGKFAAGRPFMFRGYPERGVADYASWRALLDLGEIRTEAGTPIERWRMEEIALDARRNTEHTTYWPRKGQVDDDSGNRFTLVEFC